MSDNALAATSSTVSTVEPWADSAWRRTVVLLNLTSLFSQIGQFGIGFAMVPLWMSTHGAGAWTIGVTTAALWLGMLAGLAVTPTLLGVLSPRRVVLLGLICSAWAGLLMARLHWSHWPVPALIFGFGLGLRWIANESWLYSLCPPGAKGRIVGIHETLVGAAAFIGPVLLAWSGMQSSAPFVLAAGFCGLSAVPLAFAALGNRRMPEARLQDLRRGWSLLPFIALGPLIAGLGGLIENAMYALLPVYTAGAGFDAAGSAWLLTAFGFGGMALQYPVGAYADRHGVVRCALLCTLGLALTGAALTFWDEPAIALAAALLLMGGFTSAYLTLGTIAATDTDDAAQLALRVSRLSMTFTLLSALGPLVSGGAASRFGSDSLPALVTLLSVVLALGLYAATRSRQLRPQPVRC